MFHWEKDQIISVKKTTKVLTFLMILILVSSCGLKISLKNPSIKKNKTIISGVISPLVGSISSDNSFSLLLSTANAIGCADPVYAKIFLVKADGSVDESNPISSQLVTASARYSFDGDELGLNKKDNVQYVIKADGCNNDIYKRPVTDFNDKQNLDAKTTIVAEVVNANTLLSTTLNNAKRSEVEALIESMSGTSISSALTSITTEVDPVTKFTEIFGASPSVIQNGKPSVQLNTLPSTLNELQANSFAAQAYHIDPNYSFAYSWKINGVVKSHNSVFSYTPGANESGVKTIDFYAGKDDGNGNIDLSKPYYSKTFTVLVNNNIAPTPPNITLSSANPTPVNTTTVAVDLATGVAQAQCASFSHLAITDTSAIPNAGQFIIDCATSGTQTETVAFSNGDGTKTLYIWAIDNEGHISTPKTLTLVLDTLPPVASISLASTVLKGGSSQTVTLSGSDAGVGLNTLALYFSATGSNPYTLVSNLSTSATSYSWSVPSIDTTAAKLKIVATDLTGLETTVYTNAMTIDSIAPTTPALSRTSGATSNSTTVAISTTCTADYDKIIYSESSTTPLLTATGWESCSGTKNFTASSADGAKTIYAWTRDIAGNISSSNNVTMTLDRTAPSAPVANLSSSAITSSTSLTFTITDCLDRPYVFVSESITAPLATDSGWQSCVTTASAITHTLIGPVVQGSHGLYIFAKDSVGNISLPTLSSVVYDTTKPTITLSTTLAALYKGGDVITLNFSASDTNGVSAIKIEYAADGSTFTSVTTLAGTATTYNWTIPASNTSVAKIKLTATDNATTANTETTTSAAFTVDSTAPSAPLLTRTSGLLTNATLVAMTITSCSDIDMVYVNESSIAPSVSNPGWVACSTAASNYSVSVSGQGLHTIYSWAKDAAGNISVSSNITMTLDTVLPAIAITAPAAMRGNTSTGNLAWTLTETNVAASTTFLVEIFNGSTWSTLSTPSANTGVNTSQAYSITNFAVPNVSTAAAKIRITLVDAAGNSTTTTSSDFMIDGQAPVISSVNINDGATYAGTSIVGVKVNVADNVSTGSQIKIRLSLSNTSTDSCQTEYADNSWVSWTNATTEFSFTFSPSDGVKKICAWAKDLSGNISVISPAMGVAGVDYDTITYSAGNVPQITNFNVTRTSDSGRTALSGQPLTISWTATDIEGLDNNPVSIAYTTDNTTWKDITTNLTIDTRTNMTWVGSLSGNPTSGSGSITTFTAPSSSYFRMRAQVKDMAGNTSLLAFSQPFNTGSWNVYAGTKHRGDGGTGRAATFVGVGFYNHFAINPKNGDIYAADSGNGIRKLDAKTGIVSTFMKTTAGLTTLSSTGGAIPANPLFPMNVYVNLTFDNKGKLYIGTNVGTNYTNVMIYQIDLENWTSRIYAGGGIENDGGVSATDLSLAAGGYNFDESNSLYTWTICNGTTPLTVSNYNTFPYRIVKIAQNADGTAGTTTRIIGDCTFSALSSGTAAVNQSSMPSNVSLAMTSSIIPWDNGNKIFVNLASTTARYKILNGTAYTASAGSSNGFAKYNPVDGYIYKMTSSGAEKLLINTSGANGDTVTSYFSTTSTDPGCTLDGATPTTYCGVKQNFQIHAGVPYFSDGSVSNGESVTTIRYFDSSSKLRTIFGTTPFYGDGLNKSLMRGTFAGIYYKKASEDNQAAFPEGLYFVEPTGVVFGYIHPTTGVVSTLWGNQSRIATTPVVGKIISKDFSMGHTYTYNAKPLNFDSHGLPWLRTNNDVIGIDENKKIVRYTNQTLGSGYLQSAPNGADPSKYGLMVNAGSHNFAIKNKGLFVIPTYTTIGVDPLITIRLMDFDTLVAPIILGGNFVGSDNKAASPDLLTPGTVAAAPLWTSCKNNGVCFMQYNEHNDRLYFSEGLSMRYITTPDNTSTATLKTLFTVTGSSIGNFKFNPDGSQLWYFRGNGALYCYDISSGKSWCDNTTDHFTIRTASGLGITFGPDQMTFKDNQTMFVSTNGGEILQFDLPTGP